MNAVYVVISIAGINLAVWSLLFARLRRKTEQTIDEVRRSGEDLVIPPVSANYQGWTKRYGFAKTLGRLALTNNRIIFKKPLGSDIVIPLHEVAEVSDTAHLGRRSHTFGNYLCIKLRDGTEVLFLVNDQARWIGQIRTRIG